MAKASAGVVGAIELESPMASPGPGNKLDMGSPTTWGIVFFVAALVYLFLL